MAHGRAAAITLGVALAIGAAGFGAWQFASARLHAPGPLAQTQPVMVPHGGPAELGAALQTEGIVADATAFRVAAALTRGEGPLRAGEFLLPAHASLRDILTILRTARPYQHRVTIPEGLTAAQIATILERQDALAGDVPLPAEGGVLPDSYAYERGTARAAIVERSSAAMQRTLEKIWNERTEDLPLATPQDLLTLASIVERETARPEERPHIAAVFLNRLRHGMKLQSDPTTIYAASGGLGTLDRPLTRADLEEPNPYNTYAVTGLPPGPIDSPGVAALRAVAHPAVSEDLYFVADGTGGHAFARTLEDHNRNVAHWRARTAPGN